MGWYLSIWIIQQFDNFIKNGIKHYKTANRTSKTRLKLQLPQDVFLEIKEDHPDS